MAEKKRKSKSTKKKTGGKKKASDTMKACGKAWSKSDKKGSYTAFVKKYFKEHY